jgi:hypothetical protein
MAVLLLVRQSPTQDFLSALHSMLQNAFSLALDRGLLFPYPTNTNFSVSPVSHTNPEPLLSFIASLIPHRIEDVTSSPLASAGADLDQPTRRFYAAINGRRNVAELATIAQLDVKQVYRALQTLVTQRRIKLCEPGGRLVDSSSLFDK